MFGFFQMAKERSNSSVVNQLSEDQILELIKRLEGKKHLVQSGRVIKCTLASAKYPQVTLQGTIKPLVHQVYWRYKNEFALIPEGKEISHLSGHKNHIWPTVAEDPEVNDSRKACHSKHQALGWAKKGKCPHEPPCIAEEE